MQQAAVKAGGILVSYIHIETGNESKYKYLQRKICNTDKSSAFGLLITKRPVSRSVVGWIVITGVVLGSNVSRWQSSGGRNWFGVIFRLERIFIHHVFVIERYLVIRQFVFFQFALVVIF